MTADPDRAAATGAPSASPIRTIQREIDLAAPIDVVWRALADPRELERWFPLEVRGDVAPGAALVWSWIDFDWPFRVERVEPGRRPASSTSPWRRAPGA